MPKLTTMYVTEYNIIRYTYVTRVCILFSVKKECRLALFKRSDKRNICAWEGGGITGKGGKETHTEQLNNL